MIQTVKNPISEAIEFISTAEFNTKDGIYFSVVNDCNEDDYVDFIVKNDVVTIESTNLEINAEGYELLLKRSKEDTYKEEDIEHPSIAGGIYSNIY